MTELVGGSIDTLVYYIDKLEPLLNRVRSEDWAGNVL